MVKFIIIIILSLLVFTGANAASSPDAIAIRVIPNSKHYSPERWYSENIKAKAPQSLLVDGYEAVRDGRTVYVNAANVSGSDFYTNIYLISYNQNAEQSTVDIFSQILSHWKFNTNLIQPGTCSVGTAYCKNNSDCSGNQTCDSLSGRCTAALESCSADSACPDGIFCSSLKARAVRDTKRLSDLAEIKISLDAYKDKHPAYPSLSSGTYLPGKTLSVWPSWQDAFLKEIGSAAPKDGINRLAKCGSEFDKETCWDEKNKHFAFPFSDLSAWTGSSAYVYKNISSSTYELCSFMESGLLKKADGACLE